MTALASASQRILTVYSAPINRQASLRLDERATLRSFLCVCTRAILCTASVCGLPITFRAALTRLPDDISGKHNGDAKALAPELLYNQTDDGDSDYRAKPHDDF